MTNMTRRFAVRARDLHPHHGHTVSEPTFEAAAIAFIQDLGAIDASGDVAVIVRDLDSGLEHCFLIDPGSGDAEPCA